jgi:tripartite-type tricarboxylate transporter receptor subunit TctC
MTCLHKSTLLPSYIGTTGVKNDHFGDVCIPAIFPKSTIWEGTTMRAVLLASLMALTAASASAQDFPKRPITMIVPFAPGGPTDTVARVTAESMGRILGQTIVVENVAGAGGTIGSTRVVRADPDGYTILLHHLGLATAVALYRKLPFNPVTDLKPVGVVSDVNMAIIARPGYAPNTLAEVIADIKARGDKVTFGHAGVGAANQLCGMFFMDAIKQKMTEVPFRGGGPVIQALLGDQVDLGCEQNTTAAALVQGKRVKPYAVTSAKRLPSMPDVPTAAEAGLANLEISVWHGIYVPAKTPDAVVTVLAKALAEALKDPALIKRFADITTDPTPEKATPAALAQTLQSEIDRWGPMIKATGKFAD